MKQLLKISDPVFVRPESYSRLDRFFLEYIRDERDLPFAKLTVWISLTLIPLGILLYMPFISGWMWWIIAITYAFFNHLAYKGPFGLMLHCTSHRVFFKKKYSFLNYYLPWVVAPFFGHSPETYFAHHIGMHHAENNMENDESSTMFFRRDSIGGFSYYFLKFFVRGVVDLARYFYRKKRTHLMYRTLRGEVLFFSFCIGMCFVNFWATLWVFILPMFFFRLFSIMGNWAQHAFIDPEDPGNAYKNSITCINTRYNVKCWNDGYHISHHEKQTMHWTMHPTYFLKTLDSYISEKAIVFEGIHFLHVFFWLMRKRYDLLASHFVDIGHRYQNDDEVIKLLKSRTKNLRV